MEDLVRELQRVCRTCIVVTHSFSTVRRTVDRVVFLHAGKVRWDGPVSDIDKTDNRYVRQFFSAALDGPMQVQDKGVGGDDDSASSHAAGDNPKPDSD